MSEDSHDSTNKWIECSFCGRLYWWASDHECEQQQLAAKPTNYDELRITKEDVRILHGLKVSTEGMILIEDNDETRKT